jgi:hypothetical protein
LEIPLTHKKLTQTSPPHFKKKIRMRFAKIDIWDSEALQFYLGTSLIYTLIINSEREYFFGNQCGTGALEDAPMIEIPELSDTSITFTLKLTTDLNSVFTDESWVFTDFYLGIFVFHSTCKTYTDQNSNTCTFCYPNASPSSGSCSCDDQFSLVTNCPCTSYPCSTCHACSAGFKKLQEVE